MSNGSIQGLPPTNTWLGVAPCATDPSSGTVSIIDNITITGAPGAVSSPYWSVVLNDGAVPPNFFIQQLSGSGTVINNSMEIQGGTGNVQFNAPVLLSEDPAQPTEAATKHYVDNSISSVVPVLPSSTPPLMDGTAAVGVGTAWARGDHVHPSDTSRYAASNPSGYQTAAQVTASLGAYLPLAGGTLTGPLTPAGIVGTTTNNNAAAGQVGEFINSTTTTPGVTLTNNTAANVTSISLTAGDWDVWGEAWVVLGSAGVTGSVLVAINTVSVAIPVAASANSSRQAIPFAAAALGAGILTMNAGKCRISIAATTIAYLVAQATFSSGTNTVYGMISARRRR